MAFVLKSLNDRNRLQCFYMETAQLWRSKVGEPIVRFYRSIMEPHPSSHLSWHGKPFLLQPQPS